MLFFSTILQKKAPKEPFVAGVGELSTQIISDLIAISEHIT